MTEKINEITRIQRLLVQKVEEFAPEKEIKTLIQRLASLAKDAYALADDFEKMSEKKSALVDKAIAKFGDSWVEE